MSDGKDRESALRAYILLAVLFMLLVGAGVYTVALPELADDPERAPDAGVQPQPHP